jgi:hypothetical protein
MSFTMLCNELFHQRDNKLMDTTARWDIHYKLHSTKPIIIVYMLREDNMLTVNSNYEDK